MAGLKPLDIKHGPESRFFLSTDQSGHWYLIDAERRAEWDAWTALAEDDERAWEPPAFAMRLNGSPSNVTFALYEVNE